MMAGVSEDFWIHPDRRPAPASSPFSAHTCSVGIEHVHAPAADPGRLLTEFFLGCYAVTMKALRGRSVEASKIGQILSPKFRPNFDRCSCVRYCANGCGPKMKKARSSFIYNALRALRSGGLGGNRTPDTRIFSPLLYRLSYQALF